MLGEAKPTGRHRRMLAEALARADVMLAEAIDRVKTSKEDRALVAVGGGSILVPDRIPGVSEVIRPEHFDTANAVGAAIASVSGQVDRIFHVGRGRAAGGPRRGVRRGARARGRGGRRPRHGADRRAGRDPARLPHLAIAPDPRQGRRHPRRPLGAATSRRPGPAGTPGRPGRPDPTSPPATAT